MSTTHISRDEWLKAVGDAIAPADPTAVTVMELAAMLSVDRQMAYRQVKRLIAEGKATITRKCVTNVHGHTRSMTAYKLVKPAKKRPA